MGFQDIIDNNCEDDISAFDIEHDNLEVDDGDNVEIIEEFFFLSEDDLYSDYTSPIYSEDEYLDYTSYESDISTDVESYFNYSSEEPEEPKESSKDTSIEKNQTNFHDIKSHAPTRKYSKMGKRKARRYENARQLDMLSSDTFKDEIDIDDLMPYCSFRFSQILEDKDLTNEILNPLMNENKRPEKRKDANNKKKNSTNQKDKEITPSAAFNNLDAAEKTFFKRRNLPMGMVHYLDSCVFSFFQRDPTGTYISEPLSSFERMILHGVAHYYRLKSFSYNLDHRDVRLTKVTNNHAYFNPPCLCLSQYLEEESNKAENKFKTTEKRRKLRKQNVTTSN